MFTRSDASLSSLAEQMRYDDVAKVSIDKVAKILFEILEDGDNTVDLDAIEGGYRQYIHIRLNNGEKTYNADTKQFDSKNNYYDLKRCEQSNFDNNEYEKQYYQLKKTRAQYCIDQLDGVYLQGTRDSEVLKQDNAAIVYEVLVCNEASKKDGDPACKPKKIMKLADESTDELFPIETLIAEGKDLTLYEEDPDADSIDNFTKNKKIAMKIINQKIDFTTFGDYAVRQNELFAPSIPMRSPSYSDTGYRFRYNQFDRTDGYLYPINDQDLFFDYFEYNTDIYQSAPAGLENVIAEMWYRLEVDQITHGRVVYNFMDFIGDLGGVPAIML